jgi:hypothetical protein
MRFKTVGNKVDKAFIVIRNPSSSVTIPIGAPCYFTMGSSGTTNIPPTIGIDVQNIASANGVGQSFFAGVVSESQQYGAGNIGLGPGYYGEAQVWGFVQSLRLVAQTRASSSASFSTASGTIGDILQPLTNTLALTMGTNSTGGTSAVTVSYDAFSDIGSAPTAVFTGSYASATATNVSNTVVLGAQAIMQLGQLAILAQSFSLSGSASSLLNTLAGGMAGSSGTSGSSILYSTIAVNAFLQYL